MRQGEHMLNIGGLHEGVVLDHIPAGKAMDIYKRLKLDKLDCQVAMIMHARSNKMGQKDIIKVEAPLELLNLDKLNLPKKLVNIIHCKNPRCITSIEQGLDHVFYLSDPADEIYRCVYCDEKYHSSKK